MHRILVKKNKPQPLSSRLADVASDAKVLRREAEITADKAHRLREDLHEMQRSQHADLERIKQQKPRIPLGKSNGASPKQAGNARTNRP